MGRVVGREGCYDGICGRVGRGSVLAFANGYGERVDGVWRRVVVESCQ